MVVYAAAIATLVGAIGLGTDVAIMYINWQGLQKAADAAVLAGGASLPSSDTTQAAKDVNTYLTSNGVNTATEILGAPTFGTKLVANDTVSVTLKRTVQYSFARAIGLISGDVQVTATAWAQPSGSTNDAIPISLNNNVTPDTGIPITFYGDGLDTVASHWAGLNINGSLNGTNFPTAIQNGFNGAISVGDQDPLETGLQSGPVAGAIQARIDAGMASDPTGTWNDHTAGDPRDVVVPLTTGNLTAAPGGGSDVTITGFIHLWITGETGHGNGNNPLSITGIVFTGSAEANPNGGGTGGAGSGINQVVLIQ
jgi:Flp pilus assembly protein TadG